MGESLLIKKGTENKELARIFWKLKKSKKWLYDNYSKISERYAGKYVAVDVDQIVYHDINKENLIAELRKKYKRIDYFLIELINPKDMNLII